MAGSTKALLIARRLLLSLAIVAVHFLVLLGAATCQTRAKLSGTVYFLGTTMPQFPVSLYSSDRVLQTETDNFGRFEFADLPPGTYDLQASYLGVEGTIYGVRIEDKNVGPVSVTAAFVAFLYPLDPDCGRVFWVSYQSDTIAGGRVTGSLLLYPKVPLPNAMLRKVRIDLTATGASHPRMSQHPDENGKFEFPNVPPGRYSLLAHHSGYLKVRSTIWVMRKDTTVSKIILDEHGHTAICE
ncbi:MAG: carboxypeptidase-like regulatory domain-containing protein [Candidatus Acidiferrales bacterium]